MQRTHIIALKTRTVTYFHWVAALMMPLAVLAACTRTAETADQGKRILHDSVYVHQGDQIVALTFDTLRNSLLRAIGEQNFDEAISFCSEKAYGLTDAYADTFTIRRTALRVRNPGNRPDSLELAVLIEMGNQVQAAQSPGAKVVRTSHAVHYFKPIMLQSMCLNCHGIPGDQIQPGTLSRIEQRYPQDQAVNFREGDFRGVWHITFLPEEK